LILAANDFSPDDLDFREGLYFLIPGSCH
jgi:hypothetical protein